MKLPLKYVSLLSVAFAILWVLTAEILAITNTLPQRDSLIIEIKAYAVRHVEAGSPMQTQLVLSLYQNNAVGLSTREIAKIYEEEYLRFKRKHESNFWLKFWPNAGWIAATLFFILAVFRNVIEEWVGKFLKWVGNIIYGQLAGLRVLRFISVRRYRSALVRKYKEMRVPFSPDHPLELKKIYIPLRMSGRSIGEKIEPLSAFNKYERILVTGSPGSGKSMLLKHLTLLLSGKKSEVDGYKLPVLLELNRMNHSERSLEEHLEEELRRNNFPRGRGFISNNLERGNLLLLLDGLDEVNMNERQKVVQRIRDLLSKRSGCRIIITCRTAVYKGQFDDLVDARFELAPFDDMQIYSFLNTWKPWMPELKSVEQLSQTLQDRPKIMALARNPLMLTIIAYLYTETEFELPHSRAEFYKRSSEFLLDIYKYERNRFKAVQKNLALQELALYCQDSSLHRHEDRLSIDFETAIKEIQKCLPSLGLDIQYSTAILEEIVERSGLLLSIDGGQRFQFAHLTLQEYFAAKKLQSTPDALLQRFSADRDGWREVVKLWCGLDHDSTNLIEQIYKQDPITAFECISDALSVSDSIANMIVEDFEAKLPVLGSIEDVQGYQLIVTAFGTVASDPRPRGTKVLSYLQDILADKRSQPEARVTAAKALALTNLPTAAKVLGLYYANESDEIRHALVSMGNLAVPILKDLAQKRVYDALAALGEISTPSAIHALISMLWDNNRELAFLSAEQLGSLLKSPNTEETTKIYRLSEYMRKGTWEKSTWKPFDTDDRSTISIITGRIAYLIASELDNATPTQGVLLDTRIVLPLCLQENLDAGLKVIRHEKPLNSLVELSQTQKKESPKSSGSLSEVKSFKDLLKDYVRTQPKRSNTIDTQGENLLRNIFSIGEFPDRLGKILRYLELSLALRLLLSLSECYRIPKLDDWVKLGRDEKHYDFERSIHYVTIIILTILLSLLAVFQAAAIFFSTSNPWIKLLSFFGGLVVSYCLLIFTVMPSEITGNSYHNRGPDEFIKYCVLGFKAFFEEAWGEEGEDYFVLLPFVFWFPSMCVLSASFILAHFHWPLAVLIWILIISAGVSLWIIGKSLEESKGNPLRQLTSELGILKTS